MNKTQLYIKTTLILTYVFFINFSSITSVKRTFNQPHQKDLHNITLCSIDLNVRLKLTNLIHQMPIFEIWKQNENIKGKYFVFQNKIYFYWFNSQSHELKRYASSYNLPNILGQGITFHFQKNYLATRFCLSSI